MTPKVINKIQDLNNQLDLLIEGTLNRFAGLVNQANANAQAAEERIKKMTAEQIAESKSSTIKRLCTLGMAMCITLLVTIGTTMPWEHAWLVALLIVFALFVYFTAPFAIEHQGSRQELVFTIKVLVLHALVYAIPLAIGPAVTTSLLMAEAVLAGTIMFITQ